MIFDTHRHIKHITDTGVSQASAEAIVNTVAEVLDNNLATKADLTRLESRLIKWFVGTMLVFFSANLAVTLALVTFL